MHSQAQILDIACSDATALQQQLNALYDYGDLASKIYHRYRIALFHMLLGELIGDGAIKNLGAAMDIGCNAGVYCKVLSDSGFREVFGIDINPAFVAKANQAFRSEQPEKRVFFETMDATTIRTDKQYDFILCSEVIEHTSQPEVLIKSIMSLLVPGGLAVISLPNGLSIGYSASYLSALLRGRGVNQALRDHMKYPFYKGPRLFKRNGAEILKTSGVNCIFSGRLLLVAHRTPLFGALNQLNFWLSRRWPFKCVAQFYFFVIRKTG